MANQLQGEFPAVDIKPVSHGMATVGGLRVDYAHHGPSPGIRFWTRGWAAERHLRDRMMTELSAGRKPPDLYLRGHVHERTWVTQRLYWGDAWHESHLVVVPSMCGVGAYARQIMKSVYLSTNGGVLFEVWNGKIVDATWLTHTKDIRTYEQLG